MAFKRALWHSGLTYYQVCTKCHTPVKYNDYSLDFRPWYADGFVYCPRCKAPLRHSEAFAINEDGTPYYSNSMPQVASQPVMPQDAGAAPQSVNTKAVAFCTNCGRQYNKGVDHFCSGCGNKLD